MEIKKEFPNRYQSPEWSLWDKDRGQTRAEEVKKRRPWLEARREFDNLSYRMTMLCCILNHAKGKLHMTKLLDKNDMYGWEFEKMDLEKQASVIGSYWKEFILEDSEQEVQTKEPKKSVIGRIMDKLM